MRVPYIHATVIAYSNVIARTITRVRKYEYTHAYNGRLLCGKQKNALSLQRSSFRKNATFKMKSTKVQTLSAYHSTTNL